MADSFKDERHFEDSLAGKVRLKGTKGGRVSAAYWQARMDYLKAKENSHDEDMELFWDDDEQW